MNTKYIIISLFDGLSGGRIATDRINHIQVDRYYSSEIDKYAIQIANKNYPQDEPYRLGDIKKIDGIKLREEIKREFPNHKILLLGGSPCQGFSMAGKLKGSSTKCGKDVVTLNQYLTLKEMNFEFDGQSYLFWEYVRLQKELNPDYFMLENVRVTKKWLPMFNEAMQTEPTRVNSSLVSAQNRDRYYWHNLGEIPQPEDKGILLRDVLEANADAKYDLSDVKIDRILNAKRGKGFFYTENSEKVGTFIAQYGKLPTDGSYLDHQGRKRMFTPLEAERGQTLPDNYTEGVSNSQRYKMIGNGWTIDIPAHILNYLP